MSWLFRSLCAQHHHHHHHHPSYSSCSCSSCSCSVVVVVLFLLLLLLHYDYSVVYRFFSTALSSRSVQQQHVEFRLPVELSLRRASILIGTDQNECRSIIIWNNGPPLLAAGMLRSPVRLSSVDGRLLRNPIAADDGRVLRSVGTAAWFGEYRLGIYFKVNGDWRLVAL